MTHPSYSLSSVVMTDNYLGSYSYSDVGTWTSSGSATAASTTKNTNSNR